MRRRAILIEVLRRVGIVLAASVAIGLVAGVAWWLATPLPSYTIREDGLAVISERGLALVFAADAWFTTLGILGGAGIGLLAALQLGRRIGWLVVWVVLFDATLAALLCWVIGHALGPGDFNTRLANASVGAEVPTALTVRSWVAVAVWPFMGLLPVLLWSTLARDPEEPRLIRTPWRTWREWRIRRGNNDES